MSNFGAGQGLFGSNQNKNQGAPTPATSAFGNLGANTTSSSAFGGPGVGNTPGGSGGGTAPAPSGGIFGGGSAFGGNTNANAPTSNPPGAGTGSSFGGSSLFAANPATNTGSTGPAAGGGLFLNAGPNPGTSGTTGGQGLFGNTTGANASGGGGGGGPFGFPKPAASGPSPFASGTGATGGSGGGLFSGGGNSSAAGSTAPAATGTSTASSNTLGGGLFANVKPADSAAKPATSSFFSAPTTGGAPSMGSAATGNTSSLFPSLAAKPGETSASSSAAPSTQPGGSAFRPQGTSTAAPTSAPNQSTFNLGAPAATGAAPITATAGGGLFGNIGAAANKDGKPEEKKNGTSGTSTAPPTFSLGGQPTGAATAPAAPGTEKVAAPSLFSGLGASSGAGKPATSLGGSTSTGTAPGTLALTTTSAISVAPPSMLKGKSIEEIINRWSNELEGHVRDFNKFGTEVAVWDRSLIENGNNLAALYSHVLAAEREQNDIDQSLDHIEQQEKELAATVEMYEKQMSDILGGQGGTLRTLDTGPADTERDKNYMLATELHNHLDDLSSSLTQLIDSVNSMSIGQNDGKAASADDPMAQIAHVLGNHLESLQWIDGASRELEEKVVEVEKRIKDVGTGSQATPALGGGSRSRGFGVNW